MSSAQAKAIRMLVKALAAGHPGQPVTVTFAKGNSPVFTVHAAGGFPEGMHRAAAAATTSEPRHPGRVSRHSSGIATGSLRIVDRLADALLLEALRACAHQ